MKFDVFKWEEIATGETFKAPQGRLSLMCSQVCAVYVTVEGYEALAGVGTKIDVSINQPFTFTVECPEPARVFLENPRQIHHVPVGEVFTNIDRQPDESGTVDEVRRALRAFKLEQQVLRREMRSERQALERARGERLQSEAEPAEPDPDPGDLEPEPDEPAKSSE